MTRLTTECVLNQFGVCGAFAWASFVLLPHEELFVQGGMSKVKKNKLIISLKILKEFVCDVDGSWQKQNISYNRRTWVPQEVWKTSQKV